MNMKRHRRFEFLVGKTIANSRGTAYQIVISTVFANIPSCEVILNPTTIMIR